MKLVPFICLKMFYAESFLYSQKFWVASIWEWKFLVAFDIFGISWLLICGLCYASILATNSLCILSLLPPIFFKSIVLYFGFIPVNKMENEKQTYSVYRKLKIGYWPRNLRNSILIIRLYFMCQLRLKMTFKFQTYGRPLFSSLANYRKRTYQLISYFTWENCVYKL